MPQRVPFVFAALSLAAVTSAQSPPPRAPQRDYCGTAVRAVEVSADDPGDCSYTSTSPLPQYAPTFVYRIPVVVHVIQDTSGNGYLSAAQVQAQIDVLNEDFRAKAGTAGAPGTDCAVEFYLATVDPNGLPTAGITYSTNNTWFADGGSYWNSLAWDTNRYMNIYTNNPGGYLGYVAGFPAEGNLVGMPHDRVVVLWSVFGRNGPYGPPYTMGRVACHEAGHYLGLFHTFQGSCGTSSCYITGDLICDTEPESGPIWGCPTNTSSCGRPDPVHNYMDYSDDVCKWEFTGEQARRMRCTLENWRTNLATRSNAGFVTPRIGGENPLSYASTRPILGGSVTATVEAGRTGHTTAAVLGFTAPAFIPFRGWVLLVDVTAPPGELLNLPTRPGPKAQFTYSLPSAPQLNGMVVYTQAVHFGGAPGFALSNGLDLTLGPQ